MNIHDRFFKETFGDVAVTKDFLNHYLPKSIQQYVNVESILPQKDSFIDEKLTESFSDLLFQVDILGNEGYLYFLFEHKSTPDKGTPLQLLKYIVNIWETKKDKQGNLSIIIPLVIYQGAQNWHTPRYLGEMITNFPHLPPELMVYVPNFTYQFYDFSYRSDDDIKGQAILKIYRILLREVFNPHNNDITGSIIKALNYVSEIESKTRGIEYLETVMRYVFSINQNLTEEEEKRIVLEITENYPEGSEIVMSLAERYIERGKSEGIKLGKIEGIAEGKAEGIRQIILHQLTKKLGPLPEKLVKEIAAVDLPTLEKVAGNIFEYQTVADVEEDLRK